MSRTGSWDYKIGQILRQKNFKQTLKNHGEIRKESVIANTPLLKKVCPFKPNEPCPCGSGIKFKKCCNKRK